MLMVERKRLSDILANRGGSWIDGKWTDTAPAPEFGPVDPGIYEAHVVEKRTFTAGTGTPGVKLTFLILSEGPFKGRKLWYDIWLTDAAKPMALRDFKKLGIEEQSQIDQPLPVDKHLRCRVYVSIQRDQYELPNVVKRFDPIGFDDVPAEGDERK
jgi:hypothetical protein